jgi:hypothetical protein
MPTDSSAGDNGDSPLDDTPPDRHDDLTFAAHDLGRDRALRPGWAGDDLGFAVARPPIEDPPAPSPSPAPAAGFVIREPLGVAPVAAVDALVVGASAAADEAAPAPAVLDRPFQISSTTGWAASDPSAQLLWTVREPSPGSARAPSRRGWSPRDSHLADRSADATMLRLREEAVHVSWKAAWIAVTAADPRLSRKRAF